MIAGIKKLNNGAKARQREDTEDRNLPFSNALRKYGIPATDIDFICTDGGNVIKYVLEVTRPDVEVFSPTAYLESIDQRRRDNSHGNHNDNIIATIAKKLGAVALLIVFEPNVCDAGARIWFRRVDDLKWNEWLAERFFKHLRERCDCPKFQTKSLDTPELLW